MAVVAALLLTVKALAAIAFLSLIIAGPSWISGQWRH